MADSVGTEVNTETAVEVLGMKGEGEDKKRKCRLQEFLKGWLPAGLSPTRET